jgi:hypothetical protein
MVKKQLKKLLIIFSLLFILYVGSYLFLSRRGMAEARSYRAPGFWYLFPENADAWRFWNFGLLDQKLGTGMAFAAEPLWGISHDEVPD